MKNETTELTIASCSLKSQLDGLTSDTPPAQVPAPAPAPAMAKKAAANSSIFADAEAEALFDAALEKADAAVPSGSEWQGLDDATLASELCITEARFNLTQFPSSMGTLPEEQYPNCSWEKVQSVVVGDAATSVPKAKSKHFVSCIPLHLPYIKQTAVRMQSRGLVSGQQRSGTHCVQKSIEPIDLDGISLAGVKEILGQLRDLEIAYLAYTTHSHGIKEIEKGQRWRILLPLDRVVEKSESENFTRGVCELLGIGAYDPRGAHPEQAWVEWGTTAGAKWGPVRSIGEGTQCVSVDVALGAGRKRSLSQGALSKDVFAGDTGWGSLTKVAGGQPPTKDKVRRAIQAIDANDLDAWQSVLHPIKRMSQGEDALFTDEEGLELWVGFSESAEPESKANNHDDWWNPEAMWHSQVTIDMPLDAAAGVLFKCAFDQAEKVMRSECTQPHWSPRGEHCAAFLQAYAKAARYDPILVETEVRASTDGVDKLANKWRADGGGAAVANLTDGMDVFRNQYGVTYATINVHGRVQPVNLKDDLFKHHVNAAYWEQESKVIQTAQRETMMSLWATGVPTVRNTYKRTMHNKEEEAYYIDMGQEDNRVIRVDQHKFSIEHRPEIPFLRSGGIGAFPNPVPCDSAAAAWDVLTKKMRPFFNLAGNEDIFTVFVIALLETYRPNTPYAVFELVGRSGSGKSSGGIFCRDLIDPQQQWTTIRSASKVMKDIDAVASKKHCLSFDNLTAIPPDTQNKLCELATGVVVESREYYTNSGTVSEESKAPVIITGISSVLTQDDVAVARAIQLTFQSQNIDAGEDEEDKHTKEDAILHAQWEQDRGEIFGALLTLMVHGLRGYKRVQDTPKHLIKTLGLRMVARATMGEAVFQAVGWPSGKYARVEQGMLTKVSEARGRDNPVLSFLLRTVVKWTEEGKVAYMAEQVARGGDAVIPAPEPKLATRQQRCLSKSGPGYCVYYKRGQWVLLTRPRTLLDGMRYAARAYDLGRRASRAKSVEYQLPRTGPQLSKDMDRLSTDLKNLGYDFYKQVERQAWGNTGMYFVHAPKSQNDLGGQLSGFGDDDDDDESPVEAVASTEREAILKQRDEEQLELSTMPLGEALDRVLHKLENPDS